MKCLVVYFSLNGTTERVTEAICSGLTAAGCTVETHNLKDGAPPDLKGVDMLGIGMPVYYYRMPFNVAAYIESLPDLNGLPVFTYYIYGSYAFDTGAQIKRSILKKGAMAAGTFNCHGYGLFLGYLKRGYAFSPGHPTGEALKEAKDFGFRMGSKHYGPVAEGERAPLIYRIERFVTNRWLVKNFYSRVLKRTEKCKGCGLCASECPTGNISLPERGSRPKWFRNCILCLTCAQKCPQEAVVSPFSWPVFTPFLHYNISQAARDKALSHTKVEHSKGKVTKVG